MTLQKLLEQTKTYQQMRQFFFHGELSKIMNKLLDGKIYDSNTQPLGDLLKQLSEVELFCYIWKDAYLRAYVFDAEDQRIELSKTYQIAKDILLNVNLKQAYIENHDDFIKTEYMKLKNDYSNFVKI